MGNPQSAKTKLEIAENLALREMGFHIPIHRSKTACWFWPRYRDDKGYGCIIFDGFKFAVHRLSFVLHKGRIPKGFVVMHECDNPACFNPNHLFLGTHQDNMDDMVRKGRSTKKPGQEARNGRWYENDKTSWAWRNRA